MACKITGESLRGKILDYAAGMLERSAEGLTITDGQIVDETGQTVLRCV